MNIDMTISIADIISSILSLLTLIAALYIGIIQNRINRKMLSIQDNIDIYLRIKNITDKNDQFKTVASQIEVRNISSTPLSLEGYTFNGVERTILPYRLPPAVQFPDAYYYINLPSVDVTDYASYILYFEDAFQRKWKISGSAEVRNGGWDLSWEKPKKI